MPKIIVQTDDGRVVDTFDYQMEYMYAVATLMPSVPQNMALHGLLMRLKHALTDAESVQRTGALPPARPSEQVMAVMANRRERRKSRDQKDDNDAA